MLCEVTTGGFDRLYMRETFVLFLGPRARNGPSLQTVLYADFLMMEEQSALFSGFPSHNNRPLRPELCIASRVHGLLVLLIVVHFMAGLYTGFVCAIDHADRNRREVARFECRQAVIYRYERGG